DRVVARPADSAAPGRGERGRPVRDARPAPGLRRRAGRRPAGGRASGRDRPARRLPPADRGTGGGGTGGGGTGGGGTGGGGTGGGGIPRRTPTRAGRCRRRWVRPSRGSAWT